MGAVDYFFGIELGAEHGDQAGRCRTEGELPGRYRQPALHLGCGSWLFGQPAAFAVLFGQVHQDGVGVAEDHTVVVDHRHLAEGVDGQETLLLVLALGQVDEDDLGGQLQQRQHQLDTVSVAGQGEVVELDRSAGHGGDSLSEGGRDRCVGVGSRRWL